MSCRVKRWDPGSVSGVLGEVAPFFCETFPFLGSVPLTSADFLPDSVDFSEFFALEVAFFFDGLKNLLITSPATLPRDLATRVRTKSSLRIFDHPGIPISLEIPPKSAIVNELSSFEVAIVLCVQVAKKLLGHLGAFWTKHPVSVILEDSSKKSTAPP